MEINPFVGSWKYRSFYNQPQKLDDLNKLLFGEGELRIERACPLGLEGTGTFGDGYEVRLRGSCGFGFPAAVRMQATGTGANNPGWVYDYAGYLVPAWPHGVDQRPAIVGSVIRTASYIENGEVRPAGLVATFIAVRL
ncbi:MULTISPECIES: hypothetical protein [Bradyrhizobium]|uniref:hypothetical protein n=1 Tax=Bradyrhizobium TaxID=374 RepID=UPI00155E337F|nr:MULTISPECIES: hypothetical protein [Bradyrhizobium]MDD1522916.1 hypothetical protein [Bradyrhizobium sp. WBAH30]MDD1546886.1 hypothetical protein [Bradyrhizobium sp. WBAH41]MDD1560572.1 hypothetical protein [Bradyrhizobium sp. WBAH23]MDD1567978.1 hypothetical protein [Bradyrhizobium sp. WBAH33]MDD1593958.1 hypothetical protein [Bradyrhizobium sp. WBAH42]